MSSPGGAALFPIVASSWTRDRAAHLLERAGFGGTPDEIGRLAAMTPAEAVDLMLSGAADAPV